MALVPVNSAGQFAICASAPTQIIADVSGYFTTADAATINFARGETRANRAIVSVGQNGKIALHNGSGTTQFVVDVNGYFTADSRAGGSYYVAQAPSRLIDTRTSPRSVVEVSGFDELARRDCRCPVVRSRGRLVGATRAMTE